MMSEMVDINDKRIKKGSNRIGHCERDEEGWVGYSRSC